MNISFINNRPNHISVKWVEDSVKRVRIVRSGEYVRYTTFLLSRDIQKAITFKLYDEFSGNVLLFNDKGSTTFDVHKLSDNQYLMEGVASVDVNSEYRLFTKKHCSL